MPKPTGPAAEMQDAVSNAVTVFLKAANHAFSSVEETNKEEVRRAVQDVREAQGERDELRRERDALLKEKLTSAVELEAAKGESERWRAAAEKSEWMINHQAETIAQLRLEAQQWKDQFMRVDDERLRLSARNDELVSQQLYANRREAYYQEPLTPRSQGPQAQGSSSTRAMSTTKYASSSVPASGYVTDGDVLSHRSQRDQTYSQSSRPKGTRSKVAHPAKAQPVASTSRHVSQPQPQSVSAQQQQGKVLRTVHVVMQDNPIKEESLDSVSLNGTHTGSESLGDEEEAEEEVKRRPPPPKAPLQPKSRRHVAAGKRKAAASQSQGARRRWSEGRRVHDEESESDSASEDDADEYVPSPRALQKSRARADDVDDEEEDELMLGGEADRHDTYVTQKSLTTGAHTPVRRAQTQPANASTGSGPVRKRNSPYPTVTVGKKARNR
ncbi:hypothetical protein ACEPAF_9909 [Sanghuangporus sanghuang]